MDSSVGRSAAKGQCPFRAQGGRAVAMEFLSPVEKLLKAKTCSVPSAVSPNRNVGTNIKVFLLNSFNSFNVFLNLSRDLDGRKFA